MLTRTGTWFQHERSRLPYFRHPKFAKIFTEMGAMGALWIKGTDSVTTYSSADQLDVPGRPHVVFTPGHTSVTARFISPTAVR